MDYSKLSARKLHSEWRKHLWACVCTRDRRSEHWT